MRHMKFFTPAQAAARIGVSRQSLYSWLKAGLVEGPKLIPVGGASIRLWTQEDINKAAKAKGKLKRGPKPKQRKVRR
jgi:predicted DNA-binding transcriptional regulator AlpA